MKAENIFCWIACEPSQTIYVQLCLQSTHQNSVYITDVQSKSQFLTKVFEKKNYPQILTLTLLIFMLLNKLFIRSVIHR